jgi:exopolysaccharide biosynthesis polyprenyl glycosylphosphotransferase
MNTFKRQFLLELFRLFDLSVLIFAFLGAAFLSSHSPSISTLKFLIAIRISVHNGIIFLVLLLGWHLAFLLTGMYDSRRISTLRNEIVDILKAVSACTIILFVSQLLYPMSLITPQFVAIFWLTAVVLLAAGRAGLRLLLRHLRRKGANLSYAVIVGTNPKAIATARQLTGDKDLGYIFKGFIDTGRAPETDSSFVKRYGIVSSIEDFAGYLRENVIDEVFICLPMGRFYEQISRVVALCEEHGILMRMKTDLFPLRHGKFRAEHLGDEMLLTISSGDLRNLTTVKTAMDFTGALLLLLVTAPLMLAVALAVKVTSKGAIFFVQERLGLNKRRFKLIKFRTMVPNAETKLKELEALNETHGAAFKLKNDPRITPIGRFLRRTSMDELPQLFNVLKGDMSLVGPRPLPVRDYNEFSTDWHRRRFCVKPGITCLWQVSGRSNITFDEWMELDMQYIDNWSLGLDCKILLKTVPAALLGTGAH